MHMRANQGEANDPADWASASYSEHPMDILEPEQEIQNAYREASKQLLPILSCAIEFINGSRDAHLAVLQVAVAVGDILTAGMTITDLADHCGVTKQDFSRGAVKFRLRANLPPALGMKSEAARKKYQKTNGRCH
jgi:hypothetical protein